MGTPEDSALHGLRVSVGHLLDNFGFTQISDDSLEVLSDIMKRFIKKLATNGKIYAEHAGRNSLSSDDLYCAFKKMKYSTPDLYQFIAQNNFSTPAKAMPRFPVPRSHSRPLYHPQPSEKELETRPEHIPEFYQAAHPEWTRDGADYLAVMKPSTSTDKKGAAPDFPSFLDFSSKDLGISKGDRRPAPPPLIRSDESSATGIRSSANISSMKLNSYDHPAPPPMFKRKTKPPFNGMKDSRSSTPMGRSHSPYGFFDRSESMRTESPSTSREDKPKLKPRPSLKTETKVDSPIPPVTDEGGSSPMPTLELIGGYTKDEAHDLPLTPRGSDSDTNEFSMDPYGTPRVDDSVVAANKILFERLKAEQERQNQKRKEKDKENEEKQRKKEEAKRRKEEKKREQERQKKEKEERDKQRRKEEEARLEKERKEIIEKERKELEERLRREKELERLRAAETATPPMRMAEPETNSLKLVISNPKSSHASSAFSPPSVKPSSIFETTSTSTAVNGEDDSDTIPFVEGVAAVNGATEFPLNISISAAESISSSKKKHKKKDKERDRSASPHKKHKKDKEHKKKKKEKREREREGEREKHKKKHKHSDSKEVSEQVLKVPALKIRLGDQTPSQNDTSAATSNQEIKLTFKKSYPDKKEEDNKDEKVPPLRIGVPHKEDMKPTPEKAKHINKNESKTASSKPLTEREEKQRRREERKKRERDEAQKRQKEQLERFQREHEEKQRREAEERRRKEEEQKRAEEAAERRLKEREQKEREQKEREDRERREREKEAARKEKERERERQKKESVSAPILAHVSPDTVLKKKHKKEKREREQRERDEREREKDRQKAREKEKEEKKKEEEIASDEPEIWICPACSVAWAEGVNMIACDTCNNWFHWACVGINPEHPPDEAAPWFCKKCIKKNAKRQSMPTGGGPPKKKKKSEGHEYFK